MIRRAFVAQSCLDVFRDFSKLSPWRETGGALVGYVADDSVVVVGACGPGPRAVQERNRVMIDGQYTGRFCDDVREKSDGLLDYVGDWHRHVGISLEPSDYDIEAMDVMANYEFAVTKNPVSLIYRRWPTAFKIYIFKRGDLYELPFTIFASAIERNK